MIFKLFESLSTEQYLQSELLQKQLADKFGRNFYEKPICREVCDYVKDLCQDSLLRVEDASVYKEVTNEDKSIDYEPVSQKGHTVIIYRDTLYDFTGDQYQSYGFDKANGLRIMRREKIDNDLFSGMISYKLDDYIICV